MAKKMTWSTPKMVPGPKMTWSTHKRKEPATTEDPKAVKAKQTKRQKSATKEDPPTDDKSTRKKPRGAENAAVAATSSSSHGLGRKENAGSARDNQWRKQDDWRPGPWKQDPWKRYDWSWRGNDDCSWQ